MDIIFSSGSTVCFIKLNPFLSVSKELECGNIKKIVVSKLEAKFMVLTEDNEVCFFKYFLSESSLTTLRTSTMKHKLKTILDIAWSKTDKDYVAISYDTRKIYIYNCIDKEIVSVINTLSAATAICFSPLLNEIAYVCRNGYVNIYNYKFSEEVSSQLVVKGEINHGYSVLDWNGEDMMCVKDSIRGVHIFIVTDNKGVSDKRAFQGKCMLFNEDKCILTNGKGFKITDTRIMNSTTEHSFENDFILLEAARLKHNKVAFLFSNCTIEIRCFNSGRLLEVLEMSNYPDVDLNIKNLTSF